MHLRVHFAARACFHSNICQFCLFLVFIFVYFWYFQCNIIQDLGCDIVVVGFNKGKTFQTASEKGLLWLSKNKHFVEEFCTFTCEFINF